MIKYYHAMFHSGGACMTFKIDVIKCPDAIDWCAGNDRGFVKSFADLHNLNVSIYEVTEDEWIILKIR